MLRVFNTCYEFLHNIYIGGAANTTRISNHKEYIVCKTIPIFGTICTCNGLFDLHSMVLQRVSNIDPKYYTKNIGSHIGLKSNMAYIVVDKPLAL